MSAQEYRQISSEDQRAWDLTPDPWSWFKPQRMIFVGIIFIVTGYFVFRPVIDPVVIVGACHVCDQE